MLKRLYRNARLRSYNRKQLTEVRHFHSSARETVLVMVYSLYGGGAERAACILASELAKRYRVILLFLEEKKERYLLHPEVETVCVPRFKGGLERISRCRTEFIRSLKERTGAKAAVSFMFAMNQLNAASKGTEIVICSERNNPLRKEPENMEEIRKIYEQADWVVFQSETVRSFFDDTIRAHSSVIRNPVSVSCVREKPAHRIVNIGRLHPQKNQTMLIRAFAAFYKDHPEYTLSFYGDGELLDDLQRTAETEGVSDAVFFHGNVKEIHPAVSDAEMFVLSSDYEGLSNALLECMTMGIPCISTACEGSADVIRNGENGLLTGIGEEEELKDAMARLADNPEFRNRIGEQAKKDAEEFRPQNIIGQWSALIDGLKERRR